MFTKTYKLQKGNAVGNAEKQALPFACLVFGGVAAGAGALARGEFNIGCLCHG